MAITTGGGIAYDAGAAMRQNTQLLLQQQEQNRLRRSHDLDVGKELWKQLTENPSFVENPSDFLAQNPGYMTAITKQFSLASGRQLTGDQALKLAEDMTGYARTNPRLADMYNAQAKREYADGQAAALAEPAAPKTASGNGAPASAAAAPAAKSAKPLVSDARPAKTVEPIGDLFFADANKAAEVAAEMGAGWSPLYDKTRNGYLISDGSMVRTTDGQGRYGARDYRPETPAAPMPLKGGNVRQAGPGLYYAFDAQGQPIGSFSTPEAAQAAANKPRMADGGQVHPGPQGEPVQATLADGGEPEIVVPLSDLLSLGAAGAVQKAMSKPPVVGGQAAFAGGGMAVPEQIPQQYNPQQLAQIQAMQAQAGAPVGPAAGPGQVSAYPDELALAPEGPQVQARMQADLQAQAQAQSDKLIADASAAVMASGSQGAAEGAARKPLVNIKVADIKKGVGDAGKAITKLLTTETPGYREQVEARRDSINIGKMTAKEVDALSPEQRKRMYAAAEELVQKHSAGFWALAGGAKSEDLSGRRSEMAAQKVAEAQALASMMSSSSKQAAELLGPITQGYDRIGNLIQVSQAEARAAKVPLAQYWKTEGAGLLNQINAIAATLDLFNKQLGINTNTSLVVKEGARKLFGLVPGNPEVQAGGGGRASALDQYQLSGDAAALINEY